MTNVLQRNQSMDILRIIACIGVIITHVTASVFAQRYAEIGSCSWYFCSVVNNLVHWPVPIFVMITGYFFLKPEKELPLKKLFGKNILHLVLTLVFWTWFYALFLHSLYVGYYPFGGQHTNFWYIGMCIGLYMSMPVLKVIAADQKLLSYSCWIWLFIRLYYYVGKFVDVPIVFTDHVFGGYVGCCLWGYYLTRLKLNRSSVRIIYTVGLLSWIATMILPLATGGRVTFAFEDPGTIFTSIAIFLFVIKHPVKLSQRIGNWITHLSSMTLGIYMVHTFVVIEVFTRIHRFIPNVFVLVPVSIIVIFVFSYIIILIIKQIPVLKKWVV